MEKWQAGEAKLWIIFLTKTLDGRYEFRFFKLKNNQGEPEVRHITTSDDVVDEYCEYVDTADLMDCAVKQYRQFGTKIIFHLRNEDTTKTTREIDYWQGWTAYIYRNDNPATNILHMVSGLHDRLDYREVISKDERLDTFGLEVIYRLHEFMSL